MSFVKPEIHNIITMPSEEDRVMATGNMHKNFGGLAAWFSSYASGQTDAQKHRHIHYNTSQPYREK